MQINFIRIHSTSGWHCHTSGFPENWEHQYNQRAVWGWPVYSSQVEGTTAWWSFKEGMHTLVNKKIPLVSFLYNFRFSAQKSTSWFQICSQYFPIIYRFLDNFLNFAIINLNRWFPSFFIISFQQFFPKHNISIMLYWRETMKKNSESPTSKQLCCSVYIWKNGVNLYSFCNEWLKFVAAETNSSFQSCLGWICLGISSPLRQCPGEIAHCVHLSHFPSLKEKH